MACEIESGQQAMGEGVEIKEAASQPAPVQPEAKGQPRGWSR